MCEYCAYWYVYINNTCIYLRKKIDSINLKQHICENVKSSYQNLKKEN